MIHKKVCLLGDFAVGKTSLVRRFVDRQFSDAYLSTVGVKISRKSISPPNGVETQLVLWDIEGSTRFKEITPSYLEGAHCAVVVADLSRRESVDHVHEHIERFLGINPGTPCVLALNKADLEGTVPVADFPPAGSDTRITTVTLTSAKTGVGVDDMFMALARALSPRTPA